MRSNLSLSWGVLGVGACGALAGTLNAGGLVTQDLTQGVSIDAVVSKLVGAGVTVSNVSYTGAPEAIGLFTGGTGIVGFESGIILSTGQIADAVGPNVSSSTSTDFGLPGDADLDNRNVGTTFDAAVLEFTVECAEQQSITVRYVFASEEYNEYVNSQFNDVFGFYLNGVNISYIGPDPVAINSINCGNPFSGAGPNCAFFINNDFPGGPAPINIEYDGLTVVLTATAPLQPGPNDIKIAIADVADRVLDSAIFIENGSFVCSELIDCGTENAGDCCDINNTPFCDDKACCQAVCAVDPSCCTLLWDVNCAAAAQKICEPCFDEPEPDKGSLILSAADCQDDAFPDVDGQQIIVQLDMANLTTAVSGFQAFVSYDTDVLNYNGALTEYTNSPFAWHITQPADAEFDPATGDFTPGTLRFDGSISANPNDGQSPTSDAAKLVSIVFDVKSKCETTVIGFGGSNFASELSIDGDPIPTNLTPTEEVALDDNPPALKCPDNIKVPADLFVIGDDGKPTLDPCKGAVVHYEVYAEDDCSNVTLEYSHPSGSFFAVGTTPVVVTATDKCGNQSTCTFLVTVNATNKVLANVMLWGSGDADRCILFVTDQCDVSENVVVTFGAVAMGAKGFAEFEIECGEYLFLCAKDEQHTKWDTVLLVPDAASQCWVTSEQLVLRPGDTDNDGDVDINDVTWLIATWGDPHAPGGCPWDGTRDGDFSNNGQVFTEDYSLLSAEWLTKSECLCAGGEPEGMVADGPRTLLVGPLSPSARAADLDGNGVVDWRDVRIFEQRHGLPDTLSRRMRTNN